MMKDYLLFLDESGTSSLKNIDPLFPVLVLTGLLISSDEYRALVGKVNQLKQKYFPGKHVILHRRDMRKYEKGFEIFFNDDVKRKFYFDLNKILSESDYMLISSAIDKEKHIEHYGKLADNPYQIALTFVLERSLFEADDKNARIHAYIESRGKKEDKIVTAHYDKLIHRGSYQVQPDRFLNRFENEIELRKKESGEIGIEIADLCAYPIARHVLKNNEPNPAYDVIRPKIRCGAAGSIVGYGIKIFPEGRDIK